MDISAERHDSLLIIATSGRVDGSNSQEFHQTIASTVTPDDLNILLDFGELTYISSAGLRVVLLVAKTIQQRRGRLVVCSLSESVRELFEISGFNKIIPVYNSSADAIADINAN